MKKKIILHIPHSSINIPIEGGYLVDKAILDKEILKLTDWYTADLFHSEVEDMIIADFSRIYCDPERFSDDTQEIMANFGMGVLYEKSDDGVTIRNVTPEYREKVLNDYYKPHHAKLNGSVNNQLKHFGKALILDCHSFSSKPFLRDLDQTLNRPDFNIGTDNYHTPKELTDFAIKFFEEKGYSVGLDWPYSGSIVPIEHYGLNKIVQSIMLEVNRALYLKEPGNEKSAYYPEIKKLIQEFIWSLRATL